MVSALVWMGVGAVVVVLVPKLYTLVAGWVAKAKAKTGL